MSCSVKDRWKCCVCGLVGREVRDRRVVRIVCRRCVPMLAVHPDVQHEAGMVHSMSEYRGFLRQTSRGPRVIVDVAVDGEEARQRRVYVVGFGAETNRIGVPSILRLELHGGPLDVSGLVEPLRTAVGAVVYYSGLRKPRNRDDYCDVPDGFWISVTHYETDMVDGMRVLGIESVPDVCCVVHMVVVGG